MAEVLDHSTGSGGVIIARGSRDYRWRRYALVIFIFGWGIWSIHDGFYRYPQENQAFHDKYPFDVKIPHPGLDVQFNQWFGRILPPLSIVFLGWVLYNSRSSYQFDGQTLSVPGHPSVPVQSIVKIDRSRWDRKGIAYLHYQVAGTSKLGAIRLDDFIYDRVPTDEIFKHIEAILEPGGTAEPDNPAVQ